MPSVAIVLPPREAFSAEAAGAVAMVAHSHARHGAWPATVLGRPVARPFQDAAFVPVADRRYAHGVARALRKIRPALIEVHNRPEIALFLARSFPAVTLFLHNDPRGMRAARTTAQRDVLRSRLARVFAVSNWVAARFGLGPGVSVLPNSVDLPDPPPTQRRQEILFAGRIVADKGADLFVAACAIALGELPGWTARMIGADRFGPDSPETAFLRALRPKAEAARVTMDGFRPHGDVLAAMARAAIVVVPGRWPEPFGLVALEAMASGTALVVVPSGGLADLVADAAIKVAPDAAEIATALVALARDPPRREALGEAGRVRAQMFEAAGVARRLDAHRAAILATWSAPDVVPI